MRGALSHPPPSLSLFSSHLSAPSTAVEQDAQCMPSMVSCGRGEMWEGWVRVFMKLNARALAPRALPSRHERAHPAPHPNSWALPHPHLGRGPAGAGRGLARRQQAVELIPCGRRAAQGAGRPVGLAATAAEQAHASVRGDRAPTSRFWLGVNWGGPRGAWGGGRPVSERPERAREEANVSRVHSTTASLFLLGALRALSATRVPATNTPTPHVGRVLPRRPPGRGWLL
jgi:hypothetical protein